MKSGKPVAPEVVLEPRRNIRGVPWPETTRILVIEMAMERGFKCAASHYGIPVSTIRTWIPRQKKNNGKNLRQNYKQSERQRAIKIAQEFGVLHAAQTLGIPYGTVLRWSRAPERFSQSLGYSEEKKAEAIKLAISTTSLQAGRKLGISETTVRKWLLDARPEFAKSSVPKRQYSPEQVASALRLAKIHRLAVAADLAGVPESTLKHWQDSETGRRPNPAPPNRRYPAETKAAVLKSFAENGKDKTLQTFSELPRSTLLGWASKAGIKWPVIRGKGMKWDISLAWLIEMRPDMEAWRSIAEKWLNSLSDGMSGRLDALTIFFRRYYLPNNIPPEPAHFFLRAGKRPALESTFVNSTFGKVQQNYVSEFLDYVLLHQFSLHEPDGRSYVDSIFFNPIGRASFSGAVYGSESVFNALPYQFLTECREIICEGPTFRDWAWAQKQLGVEAGQLGTVGTDWFPVNKELIDEADPDCVWRRRVRTRQAGGPLLEIWSPVRWVLQLVKLVLPFRTFQCRLLDSGEADTWRYKLDAGVGTWFISDSKLSSGSLKKPVEQGVFRRPAHDLRDLQEKKPCGWPNAVLYVNTNKTADRLKSGHRKGYVVPWITDGTLPGDCFYWLAKLVRWQEKYNPVGKKTSWAELDRRHIIRKSEIQLAGFPDACFLFRTPEAGPSEAHLPLHSGANQITWHRVLSELQKRLSSRGISNIDGSPIQLVVADSNTATLFPPHSVRVSLITALADAGIPLEFIMKLVGHARLVMTMYYRKRGQVEMAVLLEEAAVRLKELERPSVATFLKNAEHQRLLDELVVNDGEALLGAIPANPAVRNPLGWMPLHHGLCLAGGNVAKFEGGGRQARGCFNGGPNIGTDARPTYSPVPGGSKNCVRCRWFVTGPEYMPELVAHCNVLLYRFDEAKQESLKADAELQALLSTQIDAEKLSPNKVLPRDLQKAQALADLTVQRLNERAEEVVACLRLIERCKAVATTRAASNDATAAIVAVGSWGDIFPSLEQVDSELLQLEFVCEALEVFPGADAGKAVLKRNQVLQAALTLDGSPPFMLSLTDQEQLTVGNELMRKLARAANPSDLAAGRREVVSLVEARESLTRHLNLLTNQLGPPIDLPALKFRGRV